MFYIIIICYICRKYLMILSVWIVLVESELKRINIIYIYRKSKNLNRHEKIIYTICFNAMHSDECMGS